MEAVIRNWREAAILVAGAAADISMAVTRIIALSSYSLLFGVIVYLLEKGGDDMQKLIRGFCVPVMLVWVLTLGGVYDAHAAEGDQGASPAVTPVSGPLASFGLTDEQKAQVRGILSGYRPTLRPMIEHYRAERRQLRKLIHATPVDDGAIRAQVAALSSLGADLAVQRAHLIQDFRAVLTPDQLQRLSQTDDDVVGARIDRLLFRLARAGTKN